MSSSDAHQSRHSLGERTASVHRVRFEDSNEGPNEASSLTAPTPSHQRDEAAPDWHFPNYGGPNALPTGVNEAIPPNDRSIPFAQAAHNSVTPKTEPGGVDNVSFSSYRHPHDIPPPTSAYTGDKREHTPVLPLSLKKAGIDHEAIDDHEQDMVDDEDLSHPIPGEDGAGGLFSNVLHKLGVDHYDFDEEVKETHEEGDPSRPVGYKKTESFLSMDAQVLDPDDPIVTGVEKKTLDDPKDLENNVRRTINYHVRRKDRQRFRIEFNISSVLNRQKFLMRLAKSLMSFGAPSHRIEAQLLAAARILEIDAEFIHIPGVIICSFGDQDADTSELHFVKCNGRLSLGSLHKVHHIYRQVVHDEISAKAATGELDALLESPPIYNFATRIALAFWISALICPLAFGGSLIDMWIAGVGASFLSIMQIGVASKTRGLSSIRDQIFCYTAISSASIVGILPGFLILSSSLELASKNIICGSVKMVYALIYTLFLGFGLQIGSDVYLLLDRGARRDLADMAKRVLDTVKITGAFASDNSRENISRAAAIAHRLSPGICNLSLGGHNSSLCLFSPSCLRVPTSSRF
ncbi:unnamed protein product [Somion occarium]|uniref:Threonine/serine exporter-like N-terminal domain-containing protein n=1 Tax=Somion occarium TaxID=3059160 RepID=A0ABP1CIF5_9APHY